jgi:hypothetical protein
MDFTQLSELANTVIQTAVIPLVAVLWQINGRLSKIEGKLEVIEQKHD